MTDEATMLSLAQDYFHALVAEDGKKGSSLFTVDGALDPGHGAHLAGREEIRRFVSGGGREGGPRLEVRAPERFIVEGNRLTIYGFLVFHHHPDSARGAAETNTDEDVRRLRWIFHFTDDALISNVAVSAVEFFVER